MNPRLIRIGRALILAGTTLVSLYGCAVAPSDESLAPEQREQRYQQLLSAADSAEKSGNPAQALSLLSQAAQIAPAHAEPWSRTAQIELDAGSYHQAVVAAEAAVQRDPQNRAANTVLTVGGLRIASDALNRLHDAEALNDGARATAATLARALREQLETRAPAPAATAAPSKPQRRRSPRTTAPASGEAAATAPAEAASGTATAAPTAAATPAAPPVNNDPFGSLR